MLCRSRLNDWRNRSYLGMDHVEREIRPMLSNHHRHEPSPSNEVFERDEDFEILQTKFKSIERAFFPVVNYLLDIVLRPLVVHRISSNMCKEMLVD